MLEVGMKALIIGAQTEKGRASIGKVVTIHQLPEVLDYFDPSIVVVPPHLVHMQDQLKFPCLVENAAIVFGEIQSSHGHFQPGYAMFLRNHLMPIPPLKDTGIDDHTFTPIKDQQPVGA